MRASRIPALLSPDFLRFFVGSAGGLAIDLGGFALLTAAGVEPGVANLISSFTSISVVYLVVTRYAFRALVGVRTYIAFVLWYSTSIVVFSALIELATTTTGLPPLAWKLASVPVSFLLNYAFSRWLFRTREPSAALRRRTRRGSIGHLAEEAR